MAIDASSTDTLSQGSVAGRWLVSLVPAPSLPSGTTVYPSTVGVPCDLDLPSTTPLSVVSAPPPREDFWRLRWHDPDLRRCDIPWWGFHDVTHLDSDGRRYVIHGQRLTTLDHPSAAPHIVLSARVVTEIANKIDPRFRYSLAGPDQIRHAAIIDHIYRLCNVDVDIIQARSKVFGAPPLSESRRTYKDIMAQLALLGLAESDALFIGELLRTHPRMHIREALDVLSALTEPIHTRT